MLNRNWYSDFKGKSAPSTDCNKENSYFLHNIIPTNADVSEEPTNLIINNQHQDGDTLQINGLYYGNEIFTLEFDIPKITIGRSRDCDICLSNYLIVNDDILQVSRIHLTLIRLQSDCPFVEKNNETNKYIAIDGMLNGNKSKNGFFVNSNREKLAAYQILSFDSIRIGNFLELCFMYINSESEPHILDETIFE